MSEKTLKKTTFNDTVELDERFFKYFKLFEEYKQNRNQPVRFFNKNGESRNIIDYVRDSVDRMNEFHLKPDWKEDWQNNVFDPITRDKLIAILSRLASTRMKPELHIKPRSIFNLRGTEMRRRVLSDLLEAANIKNEDEEQLIWEMYTAMSEGTVFGFESWKRGARKVEYVKSYNPDTGEKETETIDFDNWDDVYGEIVPLEEFYPETIWVNNVKKLNKAFWAKKMKLSQFQEMYQHFSNATKVKNAGFYRELGDFEWGISQDVDDDGVEVLMFFDKLNDKMGIWANGVELYFGCLPWNHKELPFWSAQFEMIHNQFLYGKSLPDKLMGMQDVDNAMFNAILDQLFIGLNAPIIVDGSIDDLGEGYLEPGRYYEVQPGSKAQRLDIGGVDQTSFLMLQLIKRNMEESSISAQAHGVPTGGRKTKFEVQQLQEGALTLAGLFLQMMERAISRKYWLRTYNIMQYYSMPSRDKTGKQKFKFIVLRDTMLTNNKKGTKMIQIVGGEDEKPSPETLKMLAEQEENKPFDVMETRVEPIVITRDYLMNKDFDLEIRIVPNSSVKETEVQKKNKTLAFSQMAFQRPDLFDQEIAAKKFAEAFDQPDDVVNVKQQQPQSGQQQGLPGQPGMPGLGVNPLPEVDLL